MNWEKDYGNALVLVLLILALISILFYFVPFIGRFGTWICVTLLITVFIAVTGRGITGRYSGLLIDERNKLSLSRLQMILWTIIVISAIFTAVIANLGVENGDPLDITIPENLWILMGISTTSLVGSPLLKSDSIGGKNIKTNTKNTSASWSDLFKGESNDNYEFLDLAKIQMFFFTIIIAVAYFVSLAKDVFLVSGFIESFPDLSQGMVVLLGISNTGYLTNKVIPSKTPTPTST